MEIVSCRQGLVLIHNLTQLQLLVWDPVTGDQHRIAYPQEFFHPKGTLLSLKGTVLRAADDINGGGGSSHFQVVLVGNDPGLTEAIASVYSSETSEWGDIITTACPSMFAAPIPGFLDGGSVYWFLFGVPSVGVLEFDLDRQRLAVIEMPEEMSGLVGRFRIMRAEGGGLGFVRLSSSLRLELWKRKSNVDAGWERRSSVELDKLLSLSLDEPRELSVYEYIDENNVLLVMTRSTIFMIQLDSMQLKKSFEVFRADGGHPFPFSCIYTAGICVGGKQDGADT